MKPDFKEAPRRSRHSAVAGRFSNLTVWTTARPAFDHLGRFCFQHGVAGYIAAIKVLEKSCTPAMVLVSSHFGTSNPGQPVMIRKRPFKGHDPFVS